LAVGSGELTDDTAAGNRGSTADNPSERSSAPFLGTAARRSGEDDVPLRERFSPQKVPPPPHQQLSHMALCKGVFDE